MPENPAALHVVGVTGSGRLFHTMRTPTAWTPFVDVLGPGAANQPQLQGSVTEVAAARAINVLGTASPSGMFSEALVIVVLAMTQPLPLFFYRYADTGQWLSMGTGTASTGPVASLPLALICSHLQSETRASNPQQICISPGPEGVSSS